MNTLKLKISLLTLWMSISLVSFGQDYGKFGIRVGTTMPSGILNTLLTKGVGLGIQANSDYFYQVRGRFSADFLKYTPSNLGYSTTIYNNGMVEAASLTCRNFATLDGAIGLDYKILPERFPWFYCGPEVLIGMDLASFTYSNSNPIILVEKSGESFLHTAFKLNFGFEKSFGPLNIFGEYSLMRMRSQIYDTENTYQPDQPMFTYLSHRITVGIKF